jgi:hypothetical protein
VSGDARQFRRSGEICCDVESRAKALDERFLDAFMGCRVWRTHVVFPGKAAILR